MSDWRGPARKWFGYLLVGLAVAGLAYVVISMLMGHCPSKACGRPGVDESGSFGPLVLIGVALLFVIAIVLGRGREP